MATINGSNGVDDILPGTAGDDTINGLSGFDIAQIASTSSGAVFSRDAQGRWVVTSGQGVDTLQSVEQVNLNGEVFRLGRYELQVNTTTARDQSIPAVAMLADGGWVVTWESYGQDDVDASTGIYQQRYSSAGVAMGGEVRVNSTTPNGQTESSVTGLVDGGWVVTWASFGQDGGGYGVYQQRFSSTGAASDGEVRVNSTTSNHQEAPSVTALPDGGWLVTWQAYLQDGSDWGIYQQRFDSLGVASGAETLVNTTTASNQDTPAVTTLTDGGWVVTWQSLNQDGSSYGVVQRRYDSAGVATTGETVVNTFTADLQFDTSVAALADGGWVVTWQSYNQDDAGNNNYGIYQRQYDASNVAGLETLVNTTTAGYQQSPRVTGLDDGGWLVTWMAYAQDGENWGIYQQRFDLSGTPVGTEVQVNTTTVDAQQAPTTTALDDGGWLVSWMSHGQDGSGWGIYQQRYDAAGTPVGMGNILTGDTAANTLVFSGAESIDILGENGNDTLQGGSGDDTLEGGEGTDTVTLDAVQAASTWTLAADGRLLLGSAATGSDDLRGVEQVSTTDGMVTITWASAETRVNTTTVDDQDDSNVIGLVDGGWVVIWESYSQDDLGDPNDGLFQQRYNASGATVGVETQVNTATAGNQEEPAVTALPDGGWLVTWDSQASPGGFGWDISLQRYNAAGVAVGAETRVNTTTDSDQFGSSVTTLTGGGWLVTWASTGQDDAPNYNGGIYQQRYDEFGIPDGVETQVNSTAVFDQQYPHVTALTDGGWVVTWTSYNQDTPGTYEGGIFQQRYNAAGMTSGVETQVNTTAPAEQANPRVTALPDGGWLVTWTSYHQDNPSAYDGGIYQQRYDSLGAPVGGETQVNTTTASNQNSSRVTVLADGGWLVTWVSHNQDAPGGNNNGIYQQRFDVNGSPVNGETLVNTTTAEDQTEPAVTALADGGWMVTWTSEIQDGNGSGIYQQRYSADGLREGHLTLTGDAGASTLRMASAAEGVELIGGSGGDTLAGGAFGDRLTGGADADVFEFAASGNGVDRITDLSTNDRVRVLGATFAHAPTSGDGTTVGQNIVEVSHDGTQTLLHIGTDAVPGADVVIRIDGIFSAPLMIASGTDIYLGAPTLSAMAGPVDTVDEDTQAQITFAEIAAQGDEADGDGTVAAFVIQAMSSGTLRIGTSAGAATPFEAGVNDTVDATHQAYWTPAPHANGTLPAFTVLARDNVGYVSTGPVQVAVNVTPVADAPVLTATDLATFSQGGLTINAVGNATPYPSAVTLAGQTGTVLDVNIRLNGLSHTFPDDIDILLAGPNGQGVILMADVGGPPPIVALDLVFDDEAGAQVPDESIASGSYQPTDIFGGYAFGLPAPTGPYGTSLSVFDGISLNGEWALFVDDDASSDSGAITSWDLDIITQARRNYAENDLPLSNLATFAASDADTPNLQSATVRISAGFQTGDVLGFTNQLGISGTWNPGTQTLTLTGNTTPANYQTALAAVTFANTTDNPGNATRTLTWTLTDTGALSSTPVTTSVTVAATNDAPVVAVALLNQGAAVLQNLSVQVPAGSFTDPDGDTLTYSATQVGGAALPAWLSFNPATRTFSGTPGPLDTGVVHVRVTAADPSLASTFDDFDLTVASAAARVYIQGTDIGGGLRTLTANTAFLGAVPSAYQWYRDGSAAGVGASITVPASDNFVLYTVQVTHPGGPTTSGAVDPQAATPPAGILQSTGNPGNDTLPAAPIRAQTFIGYHGLDTITGTNGADWIDGGPDVDSMVGGLGNDTYIAHDALDVIVEAAGGGTDLVMSYVTITLPTEVENLTLVGSNPFDGTGNSLANTITGNGNANLINGLAGNDSVNAGAGNDSVDGGADNDTLNGGDGGDTLLGGTGNDSLIGAAGNDSLDGGDNDDKLDGGAAADVLLGGNGNDSLIGGGGNDMLTGGAGTDTLNGGAGADTLALDNTSIDVIQSFAVVDDTFRLSKSLFPALNLGTLNGAAFWSGTAAHDPDDRIVYNPGTGALWYDADGNGAGAAIQIATLTGLAGALTQADFVVVA